jgi:NAD+ synthase (glutamine-hydrolysing)
MQRYIHFGVSAMNTVPYDYDRNIALAHKVVDEWQRLGVTFGWFQECWLHSYGGEDDDKRGHFLATNLEEAFRFAESARGKKLIFNIDFIFKHDDDCIYNVTAMCVDGEIRGFRAKMTLAEGGEYYEGHQVYAWPKGKVETVTRLGKTFKVGDIYWNIGGVPVGVIKCQEACDPDGPGEELARRGVKIVCNPSASFDNAVGKFETRLEDWILAAGSKYNVVTLYANQLGCNGRLVFGGTSFITLGRKVHAMTPAVSMRQWNVAEAILDIEQCASTRVDSVSRYPYAQASNDERCITVDFDWPDVRPTARKEFTLPDWITGPRKRVEWAYRLEALAARDWLVKSGLQGFLLPLSGGTDSTDSEKAIEVMVHLELVEMGAEGARADFAHIEGIEKCRTKREFMKKICHCIYIESEGYSSVETLNAARVSCDVTGATFMHTKMGALYTLLQRVIKGVIGTALSWKQKRHVVVLENMQARIRALICWTLANYYNLILLNTTNRSEGCTGYGTLGGDMEGGLDLEAGQSKLLTYAKLYAARDAGVCGLPPMPELALVFKKPATAELQPAAMGQTDETALAPFEVLYLLETYGGPIGKLDPLSCFRELLVDFPTKYLPEELLNWTDKWFGLVSNSQIKREQATPGIHTTEFNVDPRSGWRRSIFSGKFKRERRQMRDWFQANREQIMAGYDRAVENDHVLPQQAHNPTGEGEALGIVDAKNAFASAQFGGELPVPSGEEVGPVIGLIQAKVPFAFTFEGADEHQEGMFNFASVNPDKTPYVDKVPDRNGKLWTVYPDHSRKGTWGAKLLPGVLPDRIDMKFPKGTEIDLDSYAVTGNPHLIPELKERQIKRVTLVGLVFRICVGMTAVELAEAGFQVRIVLEATRDLDVPAFQPTLDRMKELGVEVINLNRLLAEVGIKQ